MEEAIRVGEAEMEKKDNNHLFERQMTEIRYTI